MDSWNQNQGSIGRSIDGFNRECPETIVVTIALGHFCTFLIP